MDKNQNKLREKVKGLLEEIDRKAGDTSCLKKHLEGVKKYWGIAPKNLIADAGYGSETMNT